MRYLATILGILLLCGPVTAQEPVPTLKEDGGTVIAEHPYIKPDLTTVKPATAAQPAPPVGDINVKVPRWYPEPPTAENLDKTFWVLSGVYASGVAADVYTTKGALSRGGIESNSFYARDGGKRAAIGLNIAISAGTWGVALLLQSVGWKWPARALLGYKATRRWAAAIHNHNLLRGQ